MNDPKFSDRLLESLLTEAWTTQAMLAWERYVKENAAVDPIVLERQREGFISGFIAAGKVPPPGESRSVEVVPLDYNGILYLSRKLMPHVMAFGHHAAIAPGDMMAALLIIMTTLGRQMHPTFTNARVFEVFGAEVKVILDALDTLQEFKGEIRH